MTTYYVAKTPHSGFIGTHTLEEIVIRLRTGELQRDYAAIAVTGASYAEVKQSNVRWSTLAQLLREESISLPPNPSHLIAATQAQKSELELLQQLVHINQKQLYWIRIVGFIILFLWLSTQLYSCSHRL